MHCESMFSDELRRVEEMTPEYDFLVLGRTARAFRTHPSIQRESEQAANKAFAAAFSYAFAGERMTLRAYG